MTKRAVAVLLLLAVVVSAASLDELVRARGRGLLQTTQRSVFEKLDLECLTWNTSDRSQVRYSRRISGEPFTFCGQQIIEAVFEFDERKTLTGIEVSLYNRGDCPEWNLRRFEGAVEGVRRGMSALFGRVTPSKSRRRLDDRRVEQLIWRTAGYDAGLRWCGDDKQTEYITVTFAARGSIKNIGQDIKASVKSGELASRVKRELDGTRWIDVPMVNQGDKGYCLTAMFERLMKYYNASVDQHIFAQIMQSDPFAGTSIMQAMDALEQNHTKMRIRIKTLYKDDAFKDARGLERMLKEYNRVARRKGARKLQLPKGNLISMATLFADVDADVFTESRQARRPGVKRFMLWVKDSIDRGIPLAWMIVVLPGELSQQPYASYHARLINGYNVKDNTIIYTDSWGYGYERTAMKLDEAWSITTSLLAVTPR